MQRPGSPMVAPSTLITRWFRDVRWKLAGILGLLALITVGLIPITFGILQTRQSYALVLDVAGRQRMLLERHMKELVRSHTQLEMEIGERERAEEALRKSQAQTLETLRQSDALKSALLSSVSHELRTPLTAIKSMLFALHGGQTPREIRQEFLQSIHEEVDHLNRLVGNLLDMSRIEAGTLVPHREWHVLDELIEGAVRRVGPTLQRRPLQVDLDERLPPIYLDGLAIQQVLINLLDNAVKFSPGDSPITLQASLMGDEVEVRVSNHGEGIPPIELNKIFDRFNRCRSTQARSLPGTGLGLAICKGIIDAHGGKILVQSVPGEETTLLFRLPLTSGERFSATSPATQAATVRERSQGE